MESPVSARGVWDIRHGMGFFLGFFGTKKTFYFFPFFCSASIPSCGSQLNPRLEMHLCDNHRFQWIKMSDIQHGYRHVGNTWFNSSRFDFKIFFHEWSKFEPTTYISLSLQPILPSAHIKALSKILHNINGSPHVPAPRLTSTSNRRRCWVWYTVDRTLVQSPMEDFSFKNHPAKFFLPDP